MTRPARPPYERMMDKIETQENGCWIFTGSKTPGGYGTLLGVARNSRVYAHRLAYEHHMGAIPDGYHVDHLCQVPSCVNPDHLEAVPASENYRRVAERRTTCKFGHLYNATNTYWNRGYRYCRTCRNDRVVAARARRKDNSLVMTGDQP